MKRILLFGAFDPLHQGHLDFFKQARLLADTVLVIVACDSTILGLKKRTSFQNETVRVNAVRNCGLVDKVYLGYEGADRYRILDALDFDAIGLGYDQKPDDASMVSELVKRDKGDVEVVRLKPFNPEKYKSSLLRR